MSWEYGVNNISGFVWQGLVDVLSGPDYAFSLLGLLGLMLIVGILFVRGADYGLMLIAVMAFTMFAVLYGLLPTYLLYSIYLIGGGIILYAILKMSGAR